MPEGESSQSDQSNPGNQSNPDLSTGPDDPQNQPSGGKQGGGTATQDISLGGDQGGQDDKSGAKQVSDWREMLSDDELKEHPSIQDLQTPDDVVKKLVNAEKKIGRDKLAIPGENATEDEWDEFYQKLGRPEKPDEYELPQEGLPEDFEPNEEFLNVMQQEAHEAGLSKQQFAKIARRIINANVEHQQKQQQQQQEQKEQQLTALKKEWGEAFDQNVGLAKEAVERIGGDELKQALNQTGLGDNPALVKAFAEVGKFVKQDEVIGEGGKASLRMTPDEVDKEVERVKKENQDILTSPANQQQRQQVAQQLYELRQKKYAQSS